MKNLFLKIVLISSVFSSVPLSGMACTLKLIYATVNQILIEIDNLSIVDVLSVVDGQINEIALQISDLGAVICTELAEISSEIELLSNLSSAELLCVPISMPTTITQAGTYCLVSDIAGTITINASNVALDLNGHQVTMGIIITAGQDTVSITNGTVLGGSPGILVQTGCTNISITRVLVKNGTSGILFEQVNGGLVEHCTLTNNMTGLALINSNRINVFDTVATANMYAGFDLLTSSTNSFIECKALATGQGNTATSNNFVVGFSSANGYGNIFERCIANGTQGLLTTDLKSLIAGFALRGSETGSKIIGCESANASASGSGVTVPHGILFEYNTSNLLASIAQGDVNGQRESAQWSPDGNYILTTGATNTEIYQFDRVQNILTLIATMPLDVSSNTAQVAWSPSGNYFVTGSQNNSSNNVGKVTVYSFNQSNSSINQVATVAPNYGIKGVAWSPDEQFIVFTYNTGGSIGTNDGYLELYQFDVIQGTLTFCYSVNEPAPNGFFSSKWSPDGNYIAVASYSRAQVYAFNRALKTITFVSQDLSVNDTLTTYVSWSPDENYVAAVGLNHVQIYSFTNSVLKLVQTVTSGEIFLDIHWSPDGNYLLINGSQGSPNTIARVYSYNRSLNTLSLVAQNSVTIADVTYGSSSWSPDGQYIVIENNAEALAVVKGLAFPSNNVIIDNTVYCNGQTISASLTWGTLIGATGVGISGSSIGNMIIGNTAYNNPPVSANFFVPSNYYFVTNVFNPLFGQAPTALQNISLNANDPIVAPEDVGLLAQQILYNLCVTFPSQIEAFEQSVIAALEVSTLGPCASTPITAGTTITVAGNYCVANSMANNGNIVINASDVNLDLNNRTVTGTIIIAANMSGVSISNGTINANGAASGILVNSGASNVSISNVTVKNATTGIDFVSAYDAAVQGCTLTQNTNGLQLNNSYNVNVSDTVASSNVNAGFDLISSFTNSFINCKALSTGQNNGVIFNNEVVGFSSSNGYGNIFERCIANGTQALSTTDSNSLVAGFALRGSESCSKIIGCESANANASGMGVTVPYGILLQGTLSNVSNVTNALSENDIWAPAWSPDGEYLALVGQSSSDVAIAQFNRVANSLTLVAEASPSSGSGTVSWSPDGEYVASSFQVYSFNRTNNTLTSVAMIPSGGANSVDWSSDGNYLAVGFDIVRIYSFNRITQTLTAAAMPYVTEEGVNSVNWSADGQYLAIGTDDINGALQIVKFDSANSSVTLINAAYTGNPGGVFVNAVNWSPDDQYLAVGGFGLVIGVFTGSNVAAFQIFQYDRMTNTLNPIVGTYSNEGDFLSSVNWSPDGHYVAVGAESVHDAINDTFQIYQFDRGNGALTMEYGAFPSGPNLVLGVSWSPDGQYVAVGGVGASSGLNLFSALQFPSQNVITDNTVYCNGHDVSATFTGATGVGISGTSICNMITRNTAYNNPPTTSNFFVPSNYTFVTNVFNPLFGQAPTALQNISLNACDPISAPVDVGLLAQQILYNVEVSIPSQLDVILAAVESGSPCAPTAITTGTTIMAAGNYCVAQSITSNGNIVINANDVLLDLNNRTVTGTITIAATMSGITIRNGTINANGAGSGILVNPGASGITIANVTVKNATTGIDFMSAYDAAIQGCTLTQNSIGLQLNSSYNVQVSDTVASSNVNAGFDLVSSFTNSFINCKALSTGQNNAVIYNNEVVGFSSENGYGNIFERCVANGTQALSTTDSNSIVAGFVLRGSESCTKIIGCETANANASTSGVTVPYGILLQGTLDETFNVTGALYSPDRVNSVDWSPDGQYVAIGGYSITDGYSGNNQFQIFEFNRVANELIPITGTLSGSSEIHSVNWSPDGQYVAVGGQAMLDGQFQIFLFNRSINSLTPVAGALPSSNDLVFSVNWSPDGHYVAICGTGITDGYQDAGYQFQIFTFDRITNVLTPVAGAETVTFLDLQSVNWSPDGQYLAVGLSFPDDVRVYQFDGVTNSLTQVYFLNGGIVFSVNWSSDGYYLAVGGSGFAPFPFYDLEIFEFDRIHNELVLVAVAEFDFDDKNGIFSVNWSPDGQYVAIGGSSIGGPGQNQFQIFAFDRSNNNLTPVAGSLSDIASDYISSVNWSPDGQYVAIGGGSDNSNKFQIFTGIQFPSQNVITDNTVYCNGHDVSATFTGAVGVGISGTSICNMITRNTAYNNPPTSSNFFVPSNYYFVTNVFNQAFGQGPTALQNISLNACDPISAPEDVGLLAQQILYNVEVSIPSQLDVIQSLIGCLPTAITAGTTITAAGNYCLSTSITGNIAITASDVYLNLNNRTVTGTITINAHISSVNISNGTINANGAASGILVNAGASNVTISNVTVKNATTGIDFMSAYDATIAGCTLTQNSIGLQLNSSYNINVADTIASSNMNAGFDLISSFTNSFINCKALSTGQNNAVIYHNEVVGFSSSNGYGNIFERCIANGTQALSTTDSSSLVAGFALLGSESCSKIINSESANAIASSSGVTVPYGILLQGTLDGTFNVTGALSRSTDDVSSVNWSPDGQYVAVGGFGITDDGYQLAGYQLQIYAFDRVNNNLTPVAGTLSLGDIVESVDWSPDGQYVAIGGGNISDGYGTNNQFQIYAFDRLNNSLTPVAGAISSSGGILLGKYVQSVNWSPDGQFVATAITQVVSIFPRMVNGQLEIFEFNKITELLTSVAVVSLISGSPTITELQVDWSPDGQYVAVGGAGITGGYSGGNQFQIFEFDRSDNSLTPVAGMLSNSNDVVNSVNWSPDGHYVAIGGNTITDGYPGGNQFQIFEFDRSNNHLTPVAGILSNSNDFVHSVNWSPDGRYIAIGGNDVVENSGDQFQIFTFDRSNNSLTSVSGSLSDSADDFVNSVDWSPDGQYVVIGGSSITENSGNQFQIFTGIQFPSQNVITDNTVYCNGHDVSATFTGATGVGISGTSICNMIIGNTAYNNPPTTSNFFVPSNYQFVTNVFNQAFGQGPTALQNISLNACDPIVAPLDVGLLILQEQVLMRSVIDILKTKI